MKPGNKEKELIDRAYYMYGKMEGQYEPEKRQENAIKEMRDSFRILSRTISSGEEK
mgnify:CR=1 FL=1